MDEVTESRAEVRETKIEVDLHTEKLDFINYAYGKSLHYWKSAALKNFLTENEARELIESATRKVILVSKGKNQKFDDIEEIMFYLESQFIRHNPEGRTFISNIPCEEPSFEAIMTKWSLKISFLLVDG